MASSLLVMGGSFSATGATNRYTTLGNGRIDQTFFGITSTDITWPAGVTFKRLGCSIFANDRSGLTSGDLSATLYVNGSAQSLKVSWSMGATGLFMDSTNSVTISAGDEVSLRWNNGAGGSGGYTVRTVWVEVEHTSPITLHIANTANVVGAGTNYPPLAYGLYASTGTESVSQMPSIAGTWHDLYQLVTSNSRNGDTSFDFRDGGVTGSQGVIIPASTTGTYIDTATDSVAENDLVNLMSIRGGASGTLSAQIGCDFFTSADDRFQIYFSGELAVSPVGATNYYLPLGGTTLSTFGDNETRIIWPLTGKQLEILDIRVTVNSIASDSQLDLMVNGSAVETITITASTTGTFSLTATRAISSGDEVNLRLRAGGAGNITMRYARSVWGDSATGANGDIAQDLSFLTQSLEGSVLVEGDAAQTLSFLTQSLEGSVLVQGEAAQALSFLTEALTGDVLIEGDAAQTLRFLTQALSGANITAGDIQQTLAFLSQAIAGDVLIQGTAAQTLSFLSQSLSGSNVSAGDIAQTLARITQALEGSVLVDGDLAQTLRMITQQLYSVTVNQGDIAQTLPFLTQSLLPQEKLIKIYNILFETVKVYNIRFESTKIYNIEV